MFTGYFAEITKDTEIRVAGNDSTLKYFLGEGRRVRIGNGLRIYLRIRDDY